MEREGPGPSVPRLVFSSVNTGVPDSAGAAFGALAQPRTPRPSGLQGSGHPVTLPSHPSLLHCFLLPRARPLLHIPCLDPHLPSHHPGITFRALAPTQVGTLTLLCPSRTLLRPGLPTPDV